VCQRAVSFVAGPGPVRADRMRRVEVWSSAGQAVATALALLVAIPGVIIAARTYRDQQKLSRDQGSLNAMALEREARRYASGVSFWDMGPYTMDKVGKGKAKHAVPKTESRHVTDVRIRNTTTLPVTNLVLFSVPRPGTAGAAAYRPVVQVRTIAPCQEMIVWVERQDLYGAWQRMGAGLAMHDVPLWTTGGMYFRVGGTDWKLTNESLESVRGRRQFDGVPETGTFETARIGEEASAKPAESKVCGEDG
jgi:hypothetical protein